MMKILHIDLVEFLLFQVCILVNITLPIDFTLFLLFLILVNITLHIDINFMLCLMQIALSTCKNMQKYALQYVEVIT